MDQGLPPRIEAVNIAAGYGDRTVLRGIDLRVRAGEMVGLIGPNGSGKSTLLRVLSAGLRPSAGSVHLDGEDILALRSRDIALRLAFVPQSEPAVFDFPVRDVVLMGRHAHVRGLGGETSADFEAAARAMAAADILDLADRPVTALSGGEHRRVLIARALAQQAPTLLLDEPVAHLDITHQVEILALARRMANRDSVAVLAALHELNLAAEFCDRLVLLSDGKVLAEGTPDDVLTVDLLERAYGAALQVGHSPASGKPMVLPLPAPDTATVNCARIHVICGGATGAALLSQLVRRGYTVTAGVLNQLDSDQRAAEALGIEHVAEAPFSPIGELARTRCRDLIGRADAVILTEVPFGNGNLSNLRLALESRRSGKTVIVIESSPFASRDYTDEGEASVLWDQIVAAGATVVGDPREAANAIRVAAEDAAHAH